MAAFLTIVDALIGGLVVLADSEIRLDPVKCAVKCVDLTPLFRPLSFS